MDIEKIVEEMPKVDANSIRIDSCDRGQPLVENAIDAQCRLLAQEGYRKVPSASQLSVMLEPLIERVLFQGDISDEARPILYREIDELTSELHCLLLERE